LDPIEVVVLVSAGLAGGFLNTLAGGGSVFTIPALEWVLGSPNAANATNRIAILLQNVAAVAGYQTGKVIPWRLALGLSVPATAGGLLGAWVAAELDPGAMRVALSLGVTLVAVAALYRPPRAPRLRGVASHLAFFGVGLYLGFLQVGVGFLLLACLVGGLGMDLVRANGGKVLIVLVVVVPSLLVFGLKGQLVLLPGAVVAIGNMGGAWIAARLAIRKGAPWVRVVVVIAAVAAITKLLLFPSGPR